MELARKEAAGDPAAVTGRFRPDGSLSGTAPSGTALSAGAPSAATLDTVVVGARGSKLAQLMVTEFLDGLGSCPVVQFRTRVVTTDGDRDRTSRLSELGGAAGGAFTSALEAELHSRRIDVAIHSLKDLPTAMPDGLALAVGPPRAEPREAMCGAPLGALRYGARVGTGSARRIAQLKAVRPDLEVVPLRGNVPTRLAKLKTLGLDAVMLAAAGLERLGLADRIAELLPLEQFPPSPGQGAMGVQVRVADAELLTMLNAYGDPVADAAVRAERALLAALHGGCSVPVGAWAQVTAGGGLTLTAQVTSLDGRRQVTGKADGTMASPEQLGATLAAALLDRGAARILDEIRPPSR